MAARHQRGIGQAEDGGTGHGYDCGAPYRKHSHPFPRCSRTYAGEVALVEKGIDAALGDGQ